MLMNKISAFDQKFQWITSKHTNIKGFKSELKEIKDASNYLQLLVHLLHKTPCLLLTLYHKKMISSKVVNVLLFP